MAKKSYRMKFELIGNAADGPTVKKSISTYGDGEIGTGGGGYVMANLTANLKLVENNTQVELQVTYSVTEDNFQKKSGDDSLMMTKTFKLDVSSFTKVETTSRIVGNERITTKVSGIKLLAPNGKTPVDVSNSIKLEAGDELHKELNYSTWSAGIEQSWLPLKEVYFKVDGKGKELEKEGNLYVRGYVYFDIERVETTTKEVIRKEEAPKTPTLEYGRGEEFKVKKTETTDKVETTVKTDAEGKVVETTVKTESTNKTGGEEDPIPSVIRPVLGCGFDITGPSPSLSGCRYSVLNLNQLNKYKRIISTNNNNESENNVYTGESLTEYTKDIEKKYGLSISGNVFGATFSTEVNIAFTEHTDKKQISKYTKKDCKYIYNTYSVDEVSRIYKLHPFLSETFLKDLNDMNPTDFVNNYGTHVVLGMKVGGRFTYNMRYTENLESSSKSEKIDHTIKVGYSASGKPETQTPNPDKQAAINNILGMLKDPNTPANQLPGLATALTSLEGNKSQTSTPAPSGSGNSGWGFDVTATSSNYEKISCKNEDKVTEISCHSVGGDPAYVAAVMEDSTKLMEWSKTVAQNKAFIDFMPNKVIPIEEFIPKGYKLTKELVKEAVETHLEDKKLLITEPILDEGTVEFNTLGKYNTIVKNEDEEVDSKNDKETGWEAYLQLVSFTDGFIGGTIALTIYEGGLNSGKTILQNTKEVKLPKETYSQMVIANESQSFHVQGTVKGKHHEWIDVTEKFQSCEFLDTYNHNVYIKIDGGGSDLGNIGIKGCLKIKYRAC